VTARHSAQHPLINVSEQDLASIFGEPGKVIIYTGTVTKVCGDHIEYDINAYTGCSGAIVFLLDTDQPASVRDVDHGKAIAVHAGAHPTLVNRNLGFILKEKDLF
jgi:hypothetical protein